MASLFGFCLITLLSSTYGQTPGSVTEAVTEPVDPSTLLPKAETSEKPITQLPTPGIKTPPVTPATPNPPLITDVTEPATVDIKTPPVTPATSTPPLITEPITPPLTTPEAITSTMVNTLGPETSATVISSKAQLSTKHTTEVLTEGPTVTSKQTTMIVHTTEMNSSLIPITSRKPVISTRKTASPGQPTPTTKRTTVEPTPTPTPSQTTQSKSSAITTRLSTSTTKMTVPPATSKPGPCDGFKCSKYTHTYISCGTDGKNYQNFCYFDKAVCEYKERGLLLEKYLYGKACPKNMVVRPLAKFCDKKRCPTNRVCGTNGKTYYSKCTIDYLNCQYNSKLEVAYMGRCKSTTTTRKPTTKDPCNKSCIGSKTDRPICASNGVTYDSYCKYSKARCRIRNQGKHISISIWYQVCPKTTRTPSSSCYQRCDSSRNPMCASNGITYDNYCKYQVAKCNLQRQGTYLSLSYYGRSCRTTTTKPGCEWKSCKGKPTRYLCASNNKTYNSWCAYNNAKCIYDTHGVSFGIKHGKCGPPVIG